MTTSYTVLKDSKVDPDIKAGMIVYRCGKPDYGISSQDTRMLGYDCISVTLKEDGDYPFVSIPRHDLEINQ